MAAPDGFKVAEELRDTFLSYLTSALPIGNHASQDELGRQFYRQWSSELFAGPLVEALPTYEKVRSLSHEFGTATDRGDSLFSSTMNPPINWVDIEHKFLQFRRIRDAIWPFNSDEAEEESLATSASRFWQRELYSHQWQAFNAVARQQRNLIVATPTGSGKTECYLIPLLYKLIAEPSEMRRRPGVRAVLLYPMNALVEDQMHRLRQLLFWINLGIQSIRKCDRMITFGRYTGATPIDSADRDPQRNVSPEAMLGLGEMAFRSEMQAAPPDILVTNFTMLEYILLRGDDQQLFSVPDLFRFLVMDEVHTYTGTQGMEVALLLRRFRSFLQMRSQGKSLFQGIGTSATLPSGANAEFETVKFATSLFGLAFEKQDIIRPTIKQTRLSPVRSFDSEAICQSLANFAELFPAIGAHVGLGDAPIETNIPEGEWESLAACLVSKTAIPIPGSNYVWKRAAEILRDSPVFDLLRNVLLSEEPACISLSDLSMKLFGQNRASEKATMALLKIVGAAHSEGSPLLGIRFHMFVNEPTSAQLCLRKGENGQWWTRLFLSHHSRCDECASYVYPVLLCRRCGFAYLEGWRRRFVPSGAFGPELLPEPDDADDEATYSRIIFRPLQSNIPKEVTDQSEVHSLCLSCGRWMVAENDPNFGKIIHDCPKSSVIEVCSWERALNNGVLEECVFCEQHWIPGQDVITPPAPSVYATATVLIEELERGIERNGVDAFESKLISFSDSRQQAAQLAYRFQKTNREFTFRQVLWHAVKESPNGVRTSDLVDLLYREARDDHRLRRLLLDNEAQIHNRSMLERTITTLLFRESVTAYLTLEAQGIVRPSYDSALLENVEQVLQSDRILLGQITPEERKAFVLFLLDWNMRFRYAISPSLQGGLEVDWDWLSARNIYPKGCVASNAEAVRGELSFAISTARTQNRTFNFCKRLHERLYIGRRGLDFSISDLQAILLRLWSQVLLPYVDRTRAHADRSALYNVGRNDPDGAILKINFDSLLWRPHCGRYAYLPL
jgi:DEAD/DEAH box helicase